LGAGIGYPPPALPLLTVMVSGFRFGGCRPRGTGAAVELIRQGIEQGAQCHTFGVTRGQAFYFVPYVTALREKLSVV